MSGIVEVFFLPIVRFMAAEIPFPLMKKYIGGKKWASIWFSCEFQIWWNKTSERFILITFFGFICVLFSNMKKSNGITMKESLRIRRMYTCTGRHIETFQSHASSINNRQIIWTNFLLKAVLAYIFYSSGWP